MGMGIQLPSPAPVPHPPAPSHLPAANCLPMGPAFAALPSHTDGHAAKLDWGSGFGE